MTLYLRIILFCAMITAPVVGPAQHSRKGTSVANPAREVVIDGRSVLVPDAWVSTQDGKRLKFYSNLIEGKLVAVGFFYTSCTFVCTRHGELFSRIQRQAGKRLGKEIFLVSVSMDPSTDTPGQLMRWGKSYGRKEGWTLVTGAPDEVNGILKTLTGNSVGPRDAHSNFFYVVDEAGRWKFMPGNASAAEVEQWMSLDR